MVTQIGKIISDDDEKDAKTKYIQLKEVREFKDILNKVKKFKCRFL
jgi:hypothetical protein